MNIIKVFFYLSVLCIIFFYLRKKYLINFCFDDYYYLFYFGKVYVCIYAI